MIFLRYFQQVFSLFRVVLAQKLYLLFIILRKIYHGYISNPDVHNAIRWPLPTKSVWLTGIPDFVIKSALKCLRLFSSLCLILACLRIHFPTFGSKQLLSMFSYRPVAILKSLSKVSFFSLCYMSRFSLSPSQRGSYTVN